MSQNTFQYLCDELRATIEREDTRLTKTDKRVAITLWFLANDVDYRTLPTSLEYQSRYYTISLVVKDVSSAIPTASVHPFSIRSCYKKDSHSW